MGCLFIAPYEECVRTGRDGVGPKTFPAPDAASRRRRSWFFNYLSRGKGGVDGFLPCVPVRGGVLELDFRRSGVT